MSPEPSGGRPRARPDRVRTDKPNSSWTIRAHRTAATSRARSRCRPTRPFTVGGQARDPRLGSSPGHGGANAAPGSVLRPHSVAVRSDSDVGATGRREALNELTEAHRGRIRQSRLHCPPARSFRGARYNLCTAGTPRKIRATLPCRPSRPAAATGHARGRSQSTFFRWPLPVDYFSFRGAHK